MWRICKNRKAPSAMIELTPTRRMSYDEWAMNLRDRGSYWNIVYYTPNIEAARRSNEYIASNTSSIPRSVGPKPRGWAWVVDNYRNYSLVRALLILAILACVLVTFIYGIALKPIPLYRLIITTVTIMVGGLAIGILCNSNMTRNHTITGIRSWFLSTHTTGREQPR